MRDNTNGTEKINELIEAFNNMKSMPIIEIEVSEGEYEVYNLYADEQGIHTSCGITVNWDIDFNLDSHLDTMLDKLQAISY